MIERNKELEILYKYAGNSIRCLYSGDKEFLEYIGQNFSNIKSFERPDMYLLLDNHKLMAIEHFEFDASAFTKRKGSLDKKKLSDRNSDSEKIITTTTESVIHNTTVDCAYSAENYIQNLKNNFNKHYNKIQEYKTNLVKNNIANHINDISMCFLIENTTPLGCYYIGDDGSQKTLSLFHLTEYLEMIKNANDLDYVFYGTFNGTKNSLYFMSNREESINTIKKQMTIDFNKDKFFTFEPREQRFHIVQNEKNKQKSPGYIS